MTHAEALMKRERWVGENGKTNSREVVDAGDKPWFTTV